jgi:hypothetical protein
MRQVGVTVSDDSLVAADADESDEDADRTSQLPITSPNGSSRVISCSSITSPSLSPSTVFPRRPILASPPRMRCAGDAGVGVGVGVGVVGVGVGVGVSASAARRRAGEEGGGGRSRSEEEEGAQRRATLDELEIDAPQNRRAEKDVPHLRHLAPDSSPSEAEGEMEGRGRDRRGGGEWGGRAGEESGARCLKWPLPGIDRTTGSRVGGRAIDSDKEHLQHLQREHDRCSSRTTATHTHPPTPTHTHTHTRPHTHALTHEMHGMAHAHTRRSTDIIHGHTRTHDPLTRSMSGGAYRVTGSLVVPKTPQIIPNASSRRRHAAVDREGGGGGVTLWGGGLLEDEVDGRAGRVQLEKEMLGGDANGGAVLSLSLSLSGAAESNPCNTQYTCNTPYTCNTQYLSAERDKASEGARARERERRRERERENEYRHSCTDSNAFEYSNTKSTSEMSVGGGGGGSRSGGVGGRAKKPGGGEGKTEREREADMCGMRECESARGGGHDLGGGGGFVVTGCDDEVESLGSSFGTVVLLFMCPHTVMCVLIRMYAYNTQKGQLESLGSSFGVCVCVFVCLCLCLCLCV